MTTTDDLRRNLERQMESIDQLVTQLLWQLAWQNIDWRRYTALLDAERAMETQS